MARAARAASHAPLDDPAAVATLLDSLQDAGAGEQITVLAERAGSEASLDDPGAVGSLLDSLREVGADEQAAMLASRAVAHIPSTPAGAAVRTVRPIDRLSFLYRKRVAIAAAKLVEDRCGGATERTGQTAEG